MDGRKERWMEGAILICFFFGAVGDVTDIECTEGNLITFGTSTHPLGRLHLLRLILCSLS